MVQNMSKPEENTSKENDSKNIVKETYDPKIREPELQEFWE